MIFLLVFLRFFAFASSLYSGIFYSAIKASFVTLWRGVKIYRLLIEDEGVIGYFPFVTHRSHRLHILFSALWTFAAVLFSPIYIFPPFVWELVQIFQSIYRIDNSRPFESILSKSPSSGAFAEYHPTNFHPRWLLKVEIRSNAPPIYQQVPWSEEIKLVGYVAMSYPLRSAFKLFREAGRSLQDPSPYSKGRRWSLRDRQRISEQLLFEYAAVRGKSPQTIIETEYVWLDEFCLSDKEETDLDVIQEQRSMQLGRLADIFAGASKVVVFCHERDCDHTGSSCPWGSRLFTLAEIVHANKVVRLTRSSSKKAGSLQVHSHSEPGRVFRRNIQNKAALDRQWYLYAIMQQGGLPDAFSQQSSIHALVAETIRRDEAGNFKQHNLLGKAINGLLPRRARLADLPGKDGWADLTWLLELNQGFYNVAGLAAVCSLRGSETEVDDSVGEDPDSLMVESSGLARHPWLGKPILPFPGSERLEPIVTALPVINNDGGFASPALNIISPISIAVQKTLKRDGNAFHYRKDMEGIRIFSITLFFLTLWVVIEYILPMGWDLAFVLFWTICTFISCLKLAVGTMFLVRNGWVFLDSKHWGDHPAALLKIQDSTMEKLIHWGGAQPIPRWEVANDSSLGTLVDLYNNVCISVSTIDIPNSLVPLAIHGSGITCMLLNRPCDTTLVAERVGMGNIPPYALVNAIPTASICVGTGISSLDPTENSALENLVLKATNMHMTLTGHMVNANGYRAGEGLSGFVRNSSKSVHFEEPNLKED